MKTEVIAFALMITSVIGCSFLEETRPVDVTPNNLRSALREELALALASQDEDLAKSVVAIEQKLLGIIEERVASHLPQDDPLSLAEWLRVLAAGGGAYFLTNWRRDQMRAKRGEPTGRTAQAA